MSASDNRATVIREYLNRVTQPIEPQPSSGTRLSQHILSVDDKAPFTEHWPFWIV